MTSEDWPAVSEIYEHGIAGRNATFETEAPAWEDWDRSHHDGPRLVAVDDGRVVGWAALGPASSRPCYAGWAENSIYVDSGAQRRGVGTALLERLVADADRMGIWTIEARVFPENEATIALHLRCGFRLVGIRDRIGKLDGTWRDVLLLERRSKEV